MTRHSLIAALLITALAGCKTVDERPSERIGHAALHFADGSPAGRALLLATGSGVDISVAVTGMAGGSKGMRLHSVGQCAAPGFASAGGPLTSAGAYTDDLPDIPVGKAGAGSASATLPGMQAEIIARIFDADGTAIIVHESADGHRTDPAGNSGGSVACGIFTSG